jgi:hypothetical protein
LGLQGLLLLSGVVLLAHHSTQLVAGNQGQDERGGDGHHHDTLESHGSLLKGCIEYDASKKWASM